MEPPGSAPFFTEDGSGFGKDYLSFKEGEAKMGEFFLGGKIYSPDALTTIFGWGRTKTLKLYP